MEILITIAVAVFASTGFWSFLGDWIKTRYGKRTVLDRLVLGIAHDRIHFLCTQHLRKGWVTPDEYDTLQSIVTPYLEMGGNGSGKRLYEEVKKLPIKNVQE